MCSLYHSLEFKGHVNSSNVSVMLWCKLLRYMRASHNFGLCKHIYFLRVSCSFSNEGGVYLLWHYVPS